MMNVKCTNKNCSYLDMKNCRRERRRGWSRNLFRQHSRGPAVSFDQRTRRTTNAGARTKILSGCLVVIEMAFAAVYSVVHATHWRQKGFRPSCQFPRRERVQKERWGGKERKRGRLAATLSHWHTLSPLFLGAYFVCTRDFIHGTQITLWSRNATQTGRDHICRMNTHMPISGNIWPAICMWDIIYVNSVSFTVF